MHRTATDEDSARSVELARWLVEAGRRRPLRGGEEIACAATTPSAPADPRRVVLLGTLALAGLQYWYLDVLLEIHSLQSLIVFVLTGR